MHRRTPSSWLPSVLFALCTALALLLLLAIIACPLLLPFVSQAPALSWLLALFAQDVLLRRTSITTALGLLATAWIFFRPQIRFRRGSPRPNKPPASAKVVGA